MGVTTISPLIRLRDAEGRAAEVGVKAANLAVILRAGFTVPDGFVLPASALARALAAKSDGDAILRHRRSSRGRLVRRAVRDGARPRWRGSGGGRRPALLAIGGV